MVSWLFWTFGELTLGPSFSLGGDGDSLFDPGVAVEQREHEASHISSSHSTVWGLTAVAGHKVSLVGQKLLSCRGHRELLNEDNESHQNQFGR